MEPESAGSESEICPAAVAAVLHSLGFEQIRREELQKAHGGIVNAVYLTGGTTTHSVLSIATRSFTVGNFPFPSSSRLKLSQ